MEKMNKLVVILPLFLLSMCSDAPVTPPAGACSLPINGGDAFCPTTLPDIKPKPTFPKQGVKGEVDIYKI